MKCPKCKTDNPDDNQFCGKCATPLIDIPETPTEAPTETGEKSRKSALDFTPGQHLGKRYQIIEEIGRGGMGKIYKAVDKELNRIVALKMIKPEISSQPGIVERFKKEIKLASKITQENVCRIHDLGEAEKVINNLRKISKKRAVSPLHIAAIYSGLGNKNQAFEWLEKAYEERDHWLVWLKVLPFLDSLHSDPRFKALLKKMNLE